MPKSKVVLSEPVYDYILQMVINKELKPGDRIPETKIAEKFTISRTPVRDAMRRLSNEGIIDIFPNRYAQVKVYSEKSITEIGTLRVALDTISVKLASLYGSRSDFLHLADLAKQLEEAYEKKNSLLKKKLDCDFHLFLSQISGNELLIKYQKELYLRVQYIMIFYENPVENVKRYIKQHNEIAQALMEGNEKLAESIIIDHLTSFYNLSDKFPGNFF